ncbi:Oligopeptide transporter OPT superfamily [Cordyceps militaris]|uniref:Oligopeptide transporter OPT superfamily n=1 Tax=Cordyceps militaris TaxID=73501 RepID=A0A2H4SCW4_CORMI|nr:Oligopeptide transporter OPT superfamily [Cordyceps militaris]
MPNDSKKGAQSPASSGDVLAEKPQLTHEDGQPLAQTETQARVIMKDLNVTEDDLLEAKELAATYSLDEVKRLMTHVYKIHRRDPNFPASVIDMIDEFLTDDDIFKNPARHAALIAAMKIQTALLTANSPYAEVRAVVDHHDDPGLPASTIRSWSLGLLFACLMAFINGFFEPRFPAISVANTVPQLLAYPVGTFMARVLPDWGLTVWGVRHSLNPGPFNKKEHILVSIMSFAYDTAPYTNQIVWIQALPQYFDQGWAYDVGYQLSVALSTAFIGYGFAGITRRFIVWPSHCIWPNSLATIALNSAFHSNDGTQPVPGPFNTTWAWSRIKFFLVVFVAMFIYFWLPNTLFGALSSFSWISWIAPTNRILTAIVGSQTGLGLNPLPTFDWNTITAYLDPLYIPAFTTFNFFAGTFTSMFMVLGIWFSNAYGSGHFPINSNLPWDRFGERYNVTRVLDEHGALDVAKYETYSKPYLSAGKMVQYFCFFAVYSASITYAILQYRSEIWAGMSSAFCNMFKSNAAAREEVGFLDVHMRQMSKYREVPDWWYIVVLVLSAALGMVSMAVWPTGTSPAVVVFGILMCAIFVVPIGIMYSMTGYQVTLNVMAEFIGGAVSNGNAVSMAYFKTYGYLTCAQALTLAQDLKLGHYVKIPPRIIFWAQLVPTFISTFIFVGLLQYQLHIDKICTRAAPFRFICPAQNSFFTAAVLWGTVGPARQFGAGSPYWTLLIGFPVGVVTVLVFWGLGRRFPKNLALRSVHPVLLLAGGIGWAPYNMTHIWPAVPIAAFSWLFVRSNYLAFWSKYNYVLSAAFAAGIALSAVVQFFGLAFTGVEITWWGNSVVGLGCEGIACPLLPLPKGQGFAPKPNGQY